MSINTPLSGTISPVSGLRGGSFNPIILSPLTSLTFSALYSDLAGANAAAHGDTVARADSTYTLLSAAQTERPVLGRAPSTGVRNRILYSNALTESSSWSTTNATITEVADGFRLQDSGAGGTNTVIVRQIYTATSGTNTFSVEAKSDQLSQIALRAFGFDSSDTSFFDLSAVSVLSEGASHTALITALDDGWARASIEFNTVTDLTGVLYIYAAESGVVSIPQDGTSSVLVRRTQAEAGSRSAYQDTTNEYSVTESGVRTLEYLFFDGVDDVLSNSTFDVGSDSWTLALGVKQSSNLSVAFASSNTYLGSTTASSQTNGTFLSPQAYDGPVHVSHVNTLTGILSEGAEYVNTETGAYANTSANLTISGGAQLYSLDFYSTRLSGPVLQTSKNAISFKLGDTI